MKRFRLFERDDLIWSGNSIFEQSGPYFPRSINLEMMGQDAGATIFGQCRRKHERGGRRFSSVSFRFEPEDKTVIDFFRTLVGGLSDDIDYNIAEFLNMTARTIVVEGQFVYELQVGRDKDTKQVVERNFCQFLLRAVRYLFLVNKLSNCCLPQLQRNTVAHGFEF